MDRPRAAIAVLQGRADPRELAEIGATRFFLGRSTACDLCLVEDTVAPRHTYIHWSEEEGAYFAFDTGSTNGTVIAGRRIRRQRLEDGDELCIGEAIVRFFVGDGALDRASRALTERGGVDPLTGLGTEAAFVEAVTRATERASVEKSPLSLVSARIDGLARLREVHGEIVVRALLRELGRLVRLAFDSTVFCARLGDARIVVLVEAQPRDVWIHAEAFVRMAAEILPHASESGPERVTVSAGIAGFVVRRGAAAFVRASAAATDEAARLGGDRAYVVT